MKRELVDGLFQKFENVRHLYKDDECWVARELQVILGYSKWSNFRQVIAKAKAACRGEGILVVDHFTDIGKMIKLPKGAWRQLEDIALTRYACHLIAQQGDPAKNEIIFARAYFAARTYKSGEKLSGIIYGRGVDVKGFTVIRSKGDLAMFGGLSANDMEKKLAVPDNRPLADFLPALVIKAKDFAMELTSHNVVEKGLKGEDAISREHVDNNMVVRKILIERGIKPECLPPSEDMSRVKCLEDDGKNVMKKLSGFSKKGRSKKIIKKYNKQK